MILQMIYYKFGHHNMNNFRTNDFLDDIRVL